jgi:hypothetical protein
MLRRAQHALCPRMPTPRWHPPQDQQQQMGMSYPAAAHGAYQMDATPNDSKGMGDGAQAGEEDANGAGMQLGRGKIVGCGLGSEARVVRRATAQVGLAR